jgi:amino acid adenylation domain-containing protein
LLAAMKAGLAYVPLDPAHPAARLRHILADAKVALLIGDRTRAAEVTDAALPIVDLRSDAAIITASPATAPAIAATADPLAYAIYTSGSTGLPKGVEVTHRSLVNLLCAMARQPGLTCSDVLLAVTTVSFDIAQLELLLPLTVGATLVIAAREESADGFRLLERLRASEASAMQATPAGWRLLLEAGFVAPPGFKMLCGGEALPRDLADRLLEGAAELWNMYGPTETTIWSSCARIARGDGPITAGKPIANTQFYVLDAHDEPVAPGIPGQLHIGGDGVARGYRARAALTHEKFIANPFAAGRIYRTGDVARRLPDGDVQILGRVDHQIKLRGFRIEPGEIESLLRTRAGVAEALVVLHEDAPGQSRLVAYVVAAPDQTRSPAQLRAALARELPDHMIPSTWVALAALPRLANGKLDRAALPPPEAGARESREVIPPRSALETSLVTIWTSVLRRERVSTNDDLFDLGADSIQLFQIAARAGREGLRLTVKQLMQHPTIGELAQELTRLG